MILGDYRESGSFFFLSVAEGNRNVHACEQVKICGVESTCSVCFVEKSFVFAGVASVLQGSSAVP